MWYYLLAGVIFGRLNGIFGIVDETVSLVKNSYGFYCWWYTPSQTKLIKGTSPPPFILELQNSGTQTTFDGDKLDLRARSDDDSEDTDASSPEIILFERSYNRV
jgi:hypothetical protein